MHDFVPPSHPHEFDSIYDHVVVISLSHDCFLLDVCCFGS
jgi:hypothetical protein